MISRTIIGVTIFVLLLISILFPFPNAAAFSSNQNPAIRIGEWESSSYGVLSPSGGLAFDPSGNLWVADSNNNRVLEFTAPFSDNMSASVVIGQPDFQSTTPRIATNRLNSPDSVVFDKAGNLWVADTANNRVLEFEAPLHSSMNASVVIGQWNFSSAFFKTTRNGLSVPGQVTFDSSGDLWVADGGNGRVLEFQPPFSTGMNASLVIGEPDFMHKYCPPNGTEINLLCSSHSILTGPTGIAFDPMGELWVIEYGRLLVFRPPFKSGMDKSLLIQPVFATSLAFSAAGNLWLGCWWCGPSGGGRVLEYESPISGNTVLWKNGVALNAFASVGVYPPSGNYSFYDVNTIPNVIEPEGLTFDSAGNLWAVDARSYWLTGLLGRIVGYDAQMHPLDTFEGRVYFRNQGGLLAPLVALPVTKMDSITFPEGLFNFTIQGLPPRGSVTLTITFARALTADAKWLSKSNGQWFILPTNQVSVAGNNMTLTLNNASPNGIISVFGGPAYPPPNTTSIAGGTGTNAIPTPLTSQEQTVTLSLVLGALVILIILTIVAATRRRSGYRQRPR